MAIPELPQPVRERLVDGLGSGTGLETASAPVRSATSHAFVDALGAGLTVTAAAALAGAVLAWALLRDDRPQAPAEQEAEAAGAVQASPARA